MELLLNHPMGIGSTKTFKCMFDFWTTMQVKKHFLLFILNSSCKNGRLSCAENCHIINAFANIIVSVEHHKRIARNIWANEAFKPKWWSDGIAFESPNGNRNHQDFEMYVGLLDHHASKKHFLLFILNGSCKNGKLSCAENCHTINAFANIIVSVKHHKRIARNIFANEAFKLKWWPDGIAFESPNGNRNHQDFEMYF